MTARVTEGVSKSEEKERLLAVNRLGAVERRRSGACKHSFQYLISVFYCSFWYIL